ncbi:MAG: APC family permease [Clostridia bacterium]|nr:APC family permease [Clostridia bacterium]
MKNSNVGVTDAKLEKKLNPLNVWALAFGCIIGWGSFVNPGKKFLPNSGPAGTAIAMVLGALIMIVIAMSYSYMVPKYPEAGGEFTFTKRCIGKKSAYFCGWFLVAAYLTNVPMNSTALGLIVDGIFGPILKFGFHYSIAGFDIYLGEMLFAMLILVIFGIFCIKGVKIAGVVQTVLAITLAVSVFSLTAAALLSDKTSLANLKPLFGFDKSAAIEAYKAGSGIAPEAFAHNDKMAVFSSILATLAIAPWAFVGFDTIPQAAEEFKFPARKVNIIMTVAIIFGCFVYTANNTITAAALENWPELIVNSESTPWLLLAAAEKLLGLPGKLLVGVAVLCAVLSGIMGFYLASSRLMFSMSRDGYLPAVFSKVDSKNKTPRNALIFCMLISLSGPILGREALGWFVDMSAIGASIGFGFTCLCTIVTIKRQHEKKPLLLTLAILGAAFSVMFMILQLIPIPGLASVHFCRESYIMLAVWVAVGLVFYISRAKKINEAD